ncbi:MAG: hypothetical protein M0R02_11315 [Bacteroidales bacterium]|nr:hypothetical protein [Bacteroidales bacterium]
MNYPVAILFVCVLIPSPLLRADEIVRAVEDTTLGGAFGGATGLLVGGAMAGGLPGALLGGVVGILGGKKLQHSSGLSQRAYVIETEDGEQRTIRSPQKIHEPGDAVFLVGDRIRVAE